MEDNLKSDEDPNLNNNIKPEDKAQNNEPLNSKKEDEEIKDESSNQKIQNQEVSKSMNNSGIKENINSTSNNEKGKRHRRGKNETTAERTYKCPDCDKCYLSGPALVIHRKTKHGYNTETEKKSRGRPKKEDLQESSYQNAQNKYNEFFNNENRKKIENANKVEEITLETVKTNLSNIFRQCKNDLFEKIDEVEQYPFYKLIIDNWNNDKFPTECLTENNKPDNAAPSNKTNSPPLDIIFVLYMKELTPKTNNDYFWFVNKFIVLFREFINLFKKDQVKDEYKTEKERDYSQLFSAEGIPESCNDFFLEFMQGKKYYGLNENELIELAQHFCFWLYTNKYTHSYLTLI
jgi:hypothetical protein